MSATERTTSSSPHSTARCQALRPSGSSTTFLGFSPSITVQARVQGGENLPQLVRPGQLGQAGEGLHTVDQDLLGPLLDTRTDYRITLLDLLQLPLQGQVPQGGDGGREVLR